MSQNRTMVECVDPAIDRYLVALQGVLSGPARVRRGLVCEARDHLVDAVQGYEDAGYDRPTAVSRALMDFGCVTQIAAGYQEVLGVAASRRSAFTLLVLLLPQAFLWDKGLGLAGSDAGSDTTVVGFLNWFIGWFGFAALAGVVVALLVTGLGQRWIRAGSWLPMWTGVSVSVGALGTVVIGVSLLLLKGTTSVQLWLMIIVLMVLPMGWALRSGYRCFCLA